MTIVLLAVPKVELTGRYKRTLFGKRPEYSLLGAFKFIIKGLEHHPEIEVHINAGFKYDSATLPRIARLVFDSSDPRICVPSSFHDEAYSFAFNHSYCKLPVLISGHPRIIKLSRREIDLIYRQLLIRFGMPRWVSAFIYYPLRVGGLPAWLLSINSTKI